MHYVRTPERNQFRADLEHHIESLRILISHTTAGSVEDGDLQATGAHLSAALTRLDRHGSEIEVTGERVSSGTDCPALARATLDAAGAIQEAIACLGLLSLRAEFLLSRSGELQELSDRLARVDTAFRLVAAFAVRKRMIGNRVNCVI